MRQIHKDQFKAFIQELKSCPREWELNHYYLRTSSGKCDCPILAVGRKLAPRVITSRGLNNGTYHRAVEALGAAGLKLDIVLANIIVKLADCGPIATYTESLVLHASNAELRDMQKQMFSACGFVPDKLEFYKPAADTISRKAK